MAAGGTREPIRFIEPHQCVMVACDDVDPSDPETCHPAACGVFADARQMQPEAEVTVTWGGQQYYTVDESVCADARCKRGHHVQPGSYRAEVCASDAYRCLVDSPCDYPGDEGLFFAELDGEERCFEAEFEIPLEGGEVIIEIQ
jgi:hypothetical protein